MSALVWGEQSMESNKDFSVTANAVNKPSDHTLTTLFTGKQTCYPEFGLQWVTVETVRNCIKQQLIVKATPVLESPKGVKNPNIKIKGSVLQSISSSRVDTIKRKKVLVHLQHCTSKLVSCLVKQLPKNIIFMYNIILTSPEPQIAQR